MCGLERLSESSDLVAVTPFEFGELGSEGADDAARSFVSGRGRCRLGRCVLLLGPKLLDALAYRGAAVEEVEGDTGGLRQSAEGDRLVTADDLVQSLLSSGLSGGALAGGGLAEVVGVATHTGHLAPLLAGDRVGAGFDACAAEGLDGAVGEPGLFQLEDDAASSRSVADCASSVSRIG